MRRIATTLLLFVVLGSLPVQAQDVIRASGGTDLSVNKVTTGEYASISGPTLRETAAGQLEEGGTIVLTLPSGYIWNTDLDGESVSLTIEPVGSQNTDLDVTFTSVSESEVTLTVATESRTAGAGQGPGRFTVSGLELRPDTPDVPNEANITNTGTTGPGGSVNYGHLSTVAGSVEEVRVETDPDGSGELVPEQTLQAGQSLQVYAIARDLGGNFIENVALESGGDWQLQDVTGDISSSDLEPASNLRSATFSSEQTGSASIAASLSEATSVPSGAITFDPRSAVSMEIETQPAASAVAGEPFDPQPVLYLRDSFGNLVTTDSESEVTVSLDSGEGPLDGTPTAVAQNGVVTFSGLNVEAAGSLTLRFESSDLSSLVSDEVEVSPAAAEDLVWIEQPSNTSPDNPISPSPAVRLLDAFGNRVEQDGVDVTVDEVNLTAEPDGYLEGTTTAATDADGVATFDDLSVAEGTSEGEVQLEAAFSGIQQPVTSDTFLILDATELAGFRIFPVGELEGTPLPDVEAGESFEVTIQAIDGNGDIFTDFDGQNVEISSESEFEQGEGTTVDFIDGELASHTVELATAGEVRLYAESTEENRTGQSNRFDVLPSSADAAESEFATDEPELTADGESTTTITVQLRDRFGNALESGGETVEIETDAGTLTAGNQEEETTVTAEDQEDGTYTAELTSSTTIETATLTAWLGTAGAGSQVGQITVEFIAGSLDDIRIILPEENGSPVDQTAGVPFPVTLEALDENGNLATGFQGEVEITSTSTLADGGTVTLTDGVATDHSVTLTESGDNVTLTATDEQVTGQGGTSEPFRVLASDPDAEMSTVSSDPGLIQNDGTSTSTIRIVLRDAFGNRVSEEHSVTVSAEQLEEDNQTTGGVSPSASLGSVGFVEDPAAYEATLTSSTTIELVEVSAFFDGGATPIDQTATVNIVVPNTWESGGGPESQRIDWTRGENWSLGAEPTGEDFVIIPDGVGDYPEVVQNVTIGSLLIESGGELVLLAEIGEPDFSVLAQTEVNGTFDIEDNTSLSVGGDFNGTGSFTGSEGVTVEIAGDVSISSFLVRTDGATIRFNGEELQTLSSLTFLAENLEILNDVRVASGDLIDTAELTIAADRTLELETDADITLDIQTQISGDGTLALNNNTLVLGGNTALSDVDASQATVVFGVRPGEDPAEFGFLEQQEVSGFSEMLNVTVNNDRGVRTFEDIIVEGTLTLENGELIIESGRSLLAPDQVYESGFLTFRRTINSVRGWRMMSSPVASAYDDLFGGLVTQGIEGSTHPDDAVYQPNILWYDETHPGTDLQRWRPPEAMSNEMQTGRGYFFYVFGDVEGDDDYNDDLPVTLEVSGQENLPEQGMFDFNVTYTAEADTGWNLAGNPFGAALDWDDDTNWVKENMDNVIYLWDPDAGEYKTWNGVAGSLGSGRIAPFQAFWVKADVEDPEEESPSLQVDPGARETGGTFLQSTDAAPNREETFRLELILEAGELSTSTSFSFTEDGKVGKDRRDAWYLQPMPDTNTYLIFYSLSADDSPMAIRNFPKRSPEPFRIRLGVGGFVDGDPLHGDYTVRMGSDSTIPQGWKLLLEDRRTGETFDLNSVDEYVARVESFYPPAADRSPGVGDLHRIQPVPMRLSATPTSQAESGEQDSHRLSSTPDSAEVDHPFLLTVVPDPVGEQDVPDELFLRDNYPNPFGDVTTIEYGIPEEYDGEQVELAIFNILGQRVETPVNRPLEKGFHRLEWDASRYASGVYLYRLRVQGEIRTGKMTFIK